MARPTTGRLSCGDAIVIEPRDRGEKEFWGPTMRQTKGVFIQENRTRLLPSQTIGADQELLQDRDG